MNKSQLTKKVFLRLFSKPFTLWPFVAGVSLLLAIWAFSIQSGLALFAAIACILGAVGSFALNVMYGKDSVERAALEELRKQEAVTIESSLDELRRKLSKDGDSRTEALLKDLRALTKAFNTANVTAGLDPRSSLDIAMNVEQLFDRCIKTLEQSLELHQTAEELETEIARAPIMKRREGLIEEVRASVSTLGRILSGIQDLKQADETGGELARLRTELDESLDVAKRVEDRLKNMNDHKDASGDTPEAAP